MKLTDNFTSEELSVTSTGIYNTPGETELDKLLYLSTYILQPIRKEFGRITVSSGYRSPKVNEAIGGAKTSQHQEAEAADIVPEEASLETVFNWIRNNLKFGQVILEEKNGNRWIHVSLVRIGGQNQQAMTYKNGIYENV